VAFGKAVVSEPILTLERVQSSEESYVKRIGLILATLIGIAAFALLANRATRIPPTRAAKTNVDNPTASPDPCRLEIPWLIELQDKYDARGFTVLGVAMDEEGKSVVTPFVQNERFELGKERRNMNYRVLIGNDATTQKFGGLIGFPTSILISADGRIVRRFDGLLSYDETNICIRSQLEANESRAR
jgi:hypothetical protein